MKKIISLIILTFIIVSASPAQKVNFSLSNPRLEADKFVVDVWANVQSGQTWSVGPTCIRMRYWTVDPPNGITFIPDNPVTNAYVSLSNNSNYYSMTSTSIMGDTVVSLNIQQLMTGSALPLSTGAYWLGSLRFNYLSNGCCICMEFLPTSAVFNGLWTAMSNPADWTFTNPNPCMLSGVSQKIEEVPSDYKLSQNYPNPFNPSTSIKFSIPKSGLVTLRVYDILGREISTLVNEYKTYGTYIVDFNASGLTTGLYFYKLEVNNFVEVKKMMLVK